MVFKHRKILFWAVVAAVFGLNIYTFYKCDDGSIGEEDLKSVEIREDTTAISPSYQQEIINKVQRISKKDAYIVIDSLNTPLEASVYCNYILKHGEEPLPMDSVSFSKIHKKKITDCKGGAIAAASILSNDGFPPYLLIMENDSLSHGVFIYKNQD